MSKLSYSNPPREGAPWRVGILIFDEVEVLDFCGPFEVFATTRFLDVNGERTDKIAFSVKLISQTDSVVECRGGLKVIPDFGFANSPDFDILVVPGGWGTRKEVDNPILVKWLKFQSEKAQLMTSVCTGSFLLAKTGILDGFEVTTHWASLERLQRAFPKVKTIANKRFVITGNGKIVSSAGISSGIDMALYLVSKLVGQEIALNTANNMEYRGNFLDL
ncbi:MAG: DJ-1/PfpI family protein [Candidatus Heimdallarchaeota archaeon]